MAFDIDAYNQIFEKTKKSDKSGKNYIDEKLFVDCIQALGVRQDSSKEALKQEFQDFDVNNDKRMSKEEFCKYCIDNFGASMKVVLKFMSNKDQFTREKQIRAESTFDSRLVFLKYCFMFNVFGNSNIIL